MKLTDLCLRRPVLCTVLWLIPVFIGLIFCQKLPWRYTPQISQSKIQVTVHDSALAAQNMMTEVLIPIQNAIAGTEGISHLSATAKQGRGNIIIDVASTMDDSEIDTLVSEIHNDIGNIENKLPDDISPKVTKSDDQGMPAMLIGLTPGPHQAEYEFHQYGIDTLLPKLEQLPAAGAVSVAPSSSQSVLITLNPDKVFYYGLTINNVINKVNDVNSISAISGKTSGTESQYQLISTGAISSLDDIKNTIIATYQQQPIRLEQVADITIGTPNSQREVKPLVDFSTKNSMLFVLNPQYTATANPLVLSQQVHGLLDSMTLPSGMKAKVLLDKSTFIITALNDVYLAIGLAVILVAGVIWLFLGNLRIALIPIVTIPVCLSCSFIILKLAGFSINSLTLLAMLLAVGLVVDDAIVVVENVHRQLRFHESVYKATAIACRQIGFAIIATTLTLAAVYIPVGLVDGITGQLFQQFAFTLAGTVIISGIVALTLSPMMCSKMMNHKPPGRFETWINAQLDRLAQAYHHVLSATIDWRKTTLLVMAIIFASSYWPFTQTPSQMLPTEDSGQIFLFQPLVGSSDDASQQKMIANMNTQLKHIPDIDHVAILASSDFIRGFVTLKPWEERSLSAQKISEMINARLKEGGNRVYTGVIPAIETGGGRRGNSGGIDLNVSSSVDEQKLAKELTEVTYKIEQSPLFSNARSNLKFDRNQFKININRVLASQYDVPLRNIQQILKLAMSGKSFSNDMSYQGTNYSLHMQLESLFTLTPNSLKQLMIANKKGQLVPMSALISIENEVGPRSLEQYDRATSASLSIRLADGVSMGEGIDALNRMLPDILPANANYTYVDEAKQYLDANQQMLFVFIAALIFIYMVLSAQFESVIDALVVMLSLPITLSVALWALYFSDFTLNVYSQIGLVTLIGLICKHGILITEFANELQAEGLAPREAILTATKTRLRPILMTSLTMILGSLPLLWEAGPGANAMGSLGIIIIAGMALGIVDPLFVVPSVYLMMQKLKRKNKVKALEL
ncbi:efflux RND transporter permease subunit [Photobacterium angustum]|uniref:AcrB/AcrD/AcrF family protein n=1 Tax=Photobacterium angustum TaxID=661 RepID=A0A855SCC9_PHOAN|nr:efflux RND transporter permease subunit [Photobacterium angustum]KJF81981.1 multidrug transporter [Photobacterium damselae subsp. damselae]KJG38092.1 multidrug transporter [Photobacterium angustum]KJG45756.1 multidrug transporter [Photobacterium angustum]KJG49667.1 multidrug transporter [Photobacterium angustum]KJG51868.1 multidrug transporter [Photobacterium angustum]